MVQKHTFVNAFTHTKKKRSEQNSKAKTKKKKKDQIHLERNFRSHTYQYYNMEVATSAGQSQSPPITVEKQVTFQYANECDLEIHCSPFGLSGLYIKINGTNIMGIGSTMGLITGSTRGLIHYNDSNDLIDQKYKLYVVVDDEGMLRIDFAKIYTNSNDNDKIVLSKEGEQEEAPTLVFRGKCPEGRPDNIEPFIGIFSFERET